MNNDDKKSESKNTTSFDVDSSGDFGVNIGNGMTMDTDGDIGFSLGNGLTIDSSGDIGFKLF